MPFDNPPRELKIELSKLAKMSNIQAGLPSVLRILPVAAVIAGGAIAQVSGGSNRIEERMLGFDETILLSMPDQTVSVRFAENRGEYTQRGVMMMCARCRKTREEPGLATGLVCGDQIQWRPGMCAEQIGFGQGTRWKSIGRWW
ncbi:hypothetical protein F4803DRAFT_530058 [Xylaria telfairii]|nr:hypothetical protein F4803DRAFT_530058 [Xylaria telfairii]